MKLTGKAAFFACYAESTLTVSTLPVRDKMNVRRLFKGETVNYLAAFLYLQLLDFLTTMVGMQVGLAESSPFIRWMMNFNPAVGLAASKSCRADRKRLYRHQSPQSHQMGERLVRRAGSMESVFDSDDAPLSVVRYPSSAPDRREHSFTVSAAHQSFLLTTDN
jgi:hypothetical protein